MTSEELIIVADNSVLIKDVLFALGYEIWHTPLQIPCPVHKLGAERRPSARIHSFEDRRLWCFGCAKQYSPTEIWEAQKGVDRVEAATELLGRWPVNPERARELVRLARAVVPERSQGQTRGVLERHFRAHRGIAEFRAYRKYAKIVDEFSDYLDKLPDDSKETAIQSFVDRMNQELTDSYRTNFSGLLDFEN